VRNERNAHFFTFGGGVVTGEHMAAEAELARRRRQWWAEVAECDRQLELTRAVVLAEHARLAPAQQRAMHFHQQPLLHQRRSEAYRWARRHSEHLLQQNRVHRVLKRVGTVPLHLAPLILCYLLSPLLLKRTLFDKPKCDTPVCCNQLCVASTRPPTATDNAFDQASGDWCCTGDKSNDPSACTDSCDQDPFDCSTLTAPTTGDGS
jgi:hypothetical protein